MNHVFGAGNWRQTSGYRTEAQEDALRRRGAGTVAPGRRSAHSLGRPGAPGAYDAVVTGMPLSDAARRLRGRFPRVVAERAHGPEGAHLHIEVKPATLAVAARAAAPSCDADDIYLRVVNGRRNPRLACADQPAASNDETDAGSE
jgi:hypothetical protein